MSKIICDICGTSYMSSAESCPICGYSNQPGDDIFEDDAYMEDVLEASRNKSGLFTPASKKKEIFDYDEVNADAEYADNDEDEDDDYDDEEDNDEGDDEGSSPNVFVVILLTVLIVALLGAAAFIFFRFFLPNMGSKSEPIETTAAMISEEIQLPETEPIIPCQQMVMTNSGVAELNAEGQQFLLHVKALPENTTDQILYTSGDESIATVTADGKITAVSEGETVIHISCGEYYIGCPVIVKYVEETVPPTTETIVEETAAVEEGGNTEPVEATEAANDPAIRDDVVLKLKKTDIRLGVYYQFQLVLDCDLKPEDVTWSSEHEHIAKVDEKGNVTAIKEGTTSITAKYGSQEVQCIVRCVW